MYFVSFAVIFWVDVFTRKEYKDIVVESLQHCQHEQGLVIYGWCIMSNHVHLIISHALVGLLLISPKPKSRRCCVFVRMVL